MQNALVIWVQARGPATVGAAKRAPLESRLLSPAKDRRQPGAVQILSLLKTVDTNSSITRAFVGQEVLREVTRSIGQNQPVTPYFESVLVHP
jgi:hypothetical protein